MYINLFSYMHSVMLLSPLLVPWATVSGIKGAQKTAAERQSSFIVGVRLSRIGNAEGELHSSLGIPGED